MSDETAQETPATRQRSALWRFFARFDDTALMRCAFVGVLLGTAGVLGMDLRELADRHGGLWPSDTAETLQRLSPVLPPAVDGGVEQRQSADPRRFVTTDAEVLRQPIDFVLEADGLLRATGSIEPGAAGRLEAELEARGEYVKRVSLNSPGGALDDAIAMAAMLRERDIATVVEDGAICASSCPLMLAGGVSREVGAEAAVGLHQFYVLADTAPGDPAQAMADAQMTTARIARHLDAMGVDPALWLYALDTPPRALYYLSAEEMEQYGLVTTAEKVARR